MSLTYSRPPERDTRAPESSGPLRLAFADPPYPGQARRHYGTHADFAGEVDHEALIAQLRTFDGWALCTGAAMLRDLLPACPPGTRIQIWAKTIAPYKPGVSVQYAYEPVLIYGGRRRPRLAPMLLDVLICAPVKYRSAVTDADAAASEAPVIGMKPLAYCEWVFRSLGARAGDELTDLFPGSGAVARAWDRFTRQGELVG